MILPSRLCLEPPDASPIYLLHPFLFLQYRYGKNGPSSIDIYRTFSHLFPLSMSTEIQPQTEIPILSLSFRSYAHMTKKRSTFPATDICGNDTRSSLHVFCTCTRTKFLDLYNRSDLSGAWQGAQRRGTPCVGSSRVSGTRSGARCLKTALPSLGNPRKHDARGAEKRTERSGGAFLRCGVA